MTRRLIALFTLCAAFPSVAAAAGAEAPGAIAIPWGEWVAAAFASVSSALVPVAAAAVTAGVARVAPWATSILTRQQIEAAIRAGIAFGQNAVSGAVQGRKVSVDLGPAVVAAGTKHVVATVPARVVRKAGGVEGVAARIFRALPLEEQASAETVLEPALRLLGAARPHRG